MIEENKSSIKIGDVEGDVTVSQSQSGGTTAHTNINSNSVTPKKRSRLKWIILAIGLVASMVTILAYFGIKPN